MALCSPCRVWFAGVLQQSIQLVNEHEEALRQHNSQHLNDLFQSEFHLNRDFETVQRSFPHCWLCYRLYLLQVTTEGIDAIRKIMTLEITVTSWRTTTPGGGLEECYQIRVHGPRKVSFRSWLNLQFQGSFSRESGDGNNRDDDGIEDIDYLYKLQAGDQNLGQSQLVLYSRADGKTHRDDYSENGDIWTARFGKIRSMLDQCLESHSRCSIARHVSDPNPVLPRRLVKLSSKPELSARLVETSTINIGTPVLYATLSYCWGGESACMLIRDNLELFKAAIPIDNLSRTIKQALYAVSALGIEYAWVDSLCIVQDSPNSKDWSDEATKMHHIYGNSLINLAATSSRSSSKGFLNPLGTNPGKNIGFLLPNGTLIKELRHKIGHLCSDIYTNAYLLTRGWILQECILSPRNLHWTQAQIIWQCNEALQGELTNKGFDADEARFFMYQEPIATIPTATQLDRLWARIAAEFSRVDVTMPKDRFFAISGVAALFHERYAQLGLSTRYAAGCWEHRMLECISWTSLNRTHSRTARVKGLRLPSWSWLDTHYIDLETEELSSLASITAKVNELHIHYEEPAQVFGPISSAHIQLDAYTFKCKVPLSLQRDPAANLTFSDGTLTIWFRVNSETMTEHGLDSLWNNNGGSHRYISGLFSLDQDISIAPGTPLMCAILGARSHQRPSEDRSMVAKSWSQVNALILMPCEEGSGDGMTVPRYRRIGTLLLTRPSKSRHIDTKPDSSAVIKLDRTEFVLV